MWITSDIMNDSISFFKEINDRVEIMVNLRDGGKIHLRDGGKINLHDKGWLTVVIEILV